jgi:Tfp pilus assembly protein PilF
MSNRLSIAPLIVVLGLPALVARQVPMARQVTPSEARWQELMDEGRRLREQNRFADAEHEFQSAVGIAEEFGRQDPRYAASLNALAMIVQIRGRYDEAEAVFRRALATR